MLFCDGSQKVVEAMVESGGDEGSSGTSEGVLLPEFERGWAVSMAAALTGARAGISKYGLRCKELVIGNLKALAQNIRSDR